MIRSIELRNFQGHKFSTLQFSPGVNVIKGPSHSGKTSIVRALKWVLQNKPLGDSFMSHFAEDDTSVSIEFDDDTYIIREKGKNNRYNTNLGIFEAMRGSVPEEIEQISKMNEINIQSQHDPYFLIQDTPGNVAKKLNKVVGLEIIDEKLGRANKLINQTGAALNNAETKVDEKTEELVSYKNLEKIGEDIQKIDGCLRESWELKKKSEYLEQTHRTIGVLYEELIGLSAIVDLEEETSGIKALIKESKSLGSRYNELGYIKRDIESSRAEQERLSDWLTVDKFYKELKGLSKQHRDLSSKCVNLRSIQHTIQTQRSLILDSGKRISAKDKKYNDTLTAQNICPLCKRPFNKGEHNHGSSEM